MFFSRSRLRIPPKKPVKCFILQIRKDSSCLKRSIIGMSTSAGGLAMTSTTELMPLRFCFIHRFHPVAHRVKEILESGELGAIKSISTSLVLFKGYMKPGDIRFNYSLGGGALMDMGCGFSYLCIFRIFPNSKHRLHYQRRPLFCWCKPHVCVIGQSRTSAPHNQR